MDATERLIASLRLPRRDSHHQAATEFLIWHGYWLRRRDFTSRCVWNTDDGSYVRWREAREFSDAGPHASTSELAVLDLAVAIGENRYGLSSMGTQHRRMIVHVMAAAVGLADATEWPKS